jgi:hypothetical protein
MPLLPPIGRTACTEPQCLYKGALYLYLTVELYLYSLLLAVRPVQGCTLPFYLACMWKIEQMLKITVFYDVEPYIFYSFADVWEEPVASIFHPIVRPCTSCTLVKGYSIYRKFIQHFEGLFSFKILNNLWFLSMIISSETQADSPLQRTAVVQVRN